MGDTQMHSFVKPPLFFLLLTALVTAQPDPPPALRYEINLQATLMNGYSRGALDTWWQEMLDNPDKKVDAGSPAYFALEGRALMPIEGEEKYVTAFVSLIKPAPHALWGETIVYGGQQRIVLKPQIITLASTLQFKVTDLEGLYVDAGPALLIGWVSGYYYGHSLDTEEIDYDFARRPGFGIGVVASGRYVLNDMFVFSVNTGLRMLKTPLVIKGGEQVQLADGKKVKVGLGGFYLTYGVSFRLPEM